MRTFLVSALKETCSVAERVPRTMAAPPPASIFDRAARAVAVDGRLDDGVSDTIDWHENRALKRFWGALAGRGHRS